MVSDIKNIAITTIKICSMICRFSAVIFENLSKDLIKLFDR